jgi:hypothetical protein
MKHPLTLTVLMILGVLIFATPLIPISYSLTQNPPATQPPPPWWTYPCNTAPVRYPDGCPDMAHIEAPHTPLPPPCVRIAYTYTTNNEDDPAYTDLHLRIIIDHPEYSNNTAQIVDIHRPRHSGPSGSANLREAEILPPAPWETDYGDWSFKCGYDEAPLAWVVREILNTGDFTHLHTAYTTLPPEPLLTFLSPLSPPPKSATRPVSQPPDVLYLPLILR